MKITLTIIILSLFSSLYAQSYIRVSNNPNAIADYTNLQTAIDNAPVGATIFVEPSKTSYGDITINKRIVLLGGGYNSSKHNGNVSQVSHIYLNKQTNDPNGTSVSGFLIASFGSNYNSVYYYGSDNITVQRCNITNLFILGNGADSCSGWKIINCKLGPVRSDVSKNILISNNILNFLNGFDQYSVFVTNNVILSSYLTNSNISLSNNVFYNSPTGFSNSTFCNNLSKEGSSSFNYGNNVSISNIEGVPTTNIFVTYNSDWHLKPTCPGVNAGSDGKDIGIYGGLFPFPDEDYGITGYPEVMSIGIANPIVEPNGNLKVNVKAEIND